MMDITSVDSLNQALEFAIHDYNNVRPHYSLEGATPYAMFMGQPCDKLKIQEQMREARIARRRENNANICDSCK